MGETVHTAEETAKNRKRPGAAREAPSQKSLWARINPISVYRRRRAEKLLLNSFRNSYSKWETEGLIKKPSR